PAEVTADRTGQPTQVPLDRGLVEPHLVFHLLDLVRRRLRPEQLLRGVPRDQVQHQEGEDADPEDDRHGDQQPPADQPYGGRAQYRGQRPRYWAGTSYNIGHDLLIQTSSQMIPVFATTGGIFVVSPGPCTFFVTTLAGAKARM